HLRQALARRARRDAVALRLELRHVNIVDLVAVAVALIHFRAVNGRGEGAGLHGAALRAEAHGAAEVGLLRALLDAAGAVEPFGDQSHHGMRRVGIELGAVGAGEAGDVARELDGGELHAEADAEVGDGVFARVADRTHLAVGAALAEGARLEYRGHLL